MRTTTHRLTDLRGRAAELATLATGAVTSADFETIARLAREIDMLAEQCQSDAFHEERAALLAETGRTVDRLVRAATVAAALAAAVLLPGAQAVAQQSGTWEVSGTVEFTPQPHALSHQAGEDDEISIGDIGGVASEPQKVSIEDVVGRFLTFERCGVTDMGFEAITIHDSCYTPAVSTDWTDPDPDHLQAAADQLAERVTALEAMGPGGGTPAEIEDADQDTGCEVERTADSDTLVCRTAGADRFLVSSAGVTTFTRATAAAPGVRVLGGATGSAQANSGEICTGHGGSSLETCLGYDWNSNTGWVRAKNTSDRLLLGSGGASSTLELRADGNVVHAKGIRLTPQASPPWACSVAGDNGRQYIDDSGAACTCWGGAWVMTTNLSGSGACT